MAIKFQYNKTSLNNLGKQLKMRRNALPTLKSKESALRVSVIQAKATGFCASLTRRSGSMTISHVSGASSSRG